MASQRTLLQAYTSTEFSISIEKWWTPAPNHPEESFVNVGIIYHGDEGQKVALLSKAKTQTLIESLQAVIKE